MLLRNPASFERPPGLTFDLSLFIAGSSSRSLRTIQSVKRAFEEHFPGRYRLRVVDIHRQPELAVENQVVAAPTLLCNRPHPVRFVIGFLATPAEVLKKLKMTPLPEGSL
jgi:circadian clock protein KaiB